MSETGDVPIVADEGERRAPLDEQPIALAIAEEAGTLPDEDRRHEPEPEPEPATPTVEEILDSAGVGSRLERQLHGWKVQFADGGTVLLSEGQTISQALFGMAVKAPAPVPATEEVPVTITAVSIAEPVLMRGDGTPLHIVGGELAIKP